MDTESVLLAFLGKYHEMRKAQKQYFKTKNQGILIRSKQLEIELDQDKDSILNELCKNPENNG